MISESNNGLKRGSRKPMLRPVEAFPVKIQGQEAICLRDPNRIAPKSLFLQAGAAFVLALLDGQNDLRDIQAAWMRRFGQLIPFEDIEGLISQLDENLYLEGERFDRFLAELEAEFAASPSRPAMMAGQAYAADPEDLTRQLEAFYHHPAGPGRDPKPALLKPPRGLVAPHIDFDRGGHCYAWAYDRLTDSQPPGLVVVLGTAHSPTENYLIACDKDLDTPFGPLKCEKDLMADLAARSGPGLKAEEFIHRGEHSVEFQAVWLKSLYRNDEEIRVLPLLCGSFHRIVEAGRGPEDVEAYRNARDVLKELLYQWEKTKGRVLILASVDLSHVGPQFGDGFRITGPVQQEIREHDLELLRLVTEGDSQGFYLKIAQEQDRRHVCGLPSLYTMLRLLDDAEGQLLSYDQWVDETGQGLVSFASLIFP
ncbi:MAG: AmmeMemoRadiSam system protein B [Deltaproteobacteria bacterium]|nr:AmmeMemoRadiSam system protein B [Deltaproteobacteria bacterium]